MMIKTIHLVSIGKCCIDVKIGFGWVFFWYFVMKVIVREFREVIKKKNLWNIFKFST